MFAAKWSFITSKSKGEGWMIYGYHAWINLKMLEQFESRWTMNSNVKDVEVSAFTGCCVDFVYILNDIVVLYEPIQPDDVQLIVCSWNTSDVIIHIDRAKGCCQKTPQSTVWRLKQNKRLSQYLHKHNTRCQITL